MRRRITLVGIVATLFSIGLASSGPAGAATPPPKPPTPANTKTYAGVWDPPIGRGIRSAPHIRLNEAQYICGQPIIQIIFDTETLIGKEWTPTQDNSRTLVQVHFIGNGAGAGGTWETVTSTSGGEHRLRVNIATQTLPTWDLMRVIREDTGIASSGRPPADDCL